MDNRKQQKLKHSRLKELFNLKNCKLNLLKFYQGKDLQKGNIIQTAVFKKV